MPSMSRGSSPASAMAFFTASHAIDNVVRFDGRMWGVSPTPTMQYLSVKAPMCSPLSLYFHVMANFLNELLCSSDVLSFRRTEPDYNTIKYAFVACGEFL